MSGVEVVANVPGLRQLQWRELIVAASLGAFSTVTWELMAARGVIGVGVAPVMPGTLSILATVFPPAEGPRAIAIWA